MALTSTKLPMDARPAMMSCAASTITMAMPMEKITAWPALSTASEV